MMKFIKYGLVLFVTASSAFAASPRCYRGSLGEKSFTLKLSPQKGTVTLMEVSMTAEGTTFSEIAIGDDRALKILDNGGKVDFGVEDDGGHSVVSGLSSTRLSVEGQKGYSMVLIKVGTDRYSEDFDEVTSLRRFPEKSVRFRKVSCLKLTAK